MAQVVLVVDDLKYIGGIFRCRICHEEEDFENSTSMEAPCSCSGTIKFAHRDCIQRWCNEKGNTICEICLQEYGPGYTAPVKKYDENDEAMSIGEEEELNTRIEEMEEGVTLDSECTFVADTNPSHLRLLAFTIIIVLLLRHFLAVCTNGTEDYPFTTFTVVILKASGVIIPMYLIIRIVGAIQNSIQHHHQDYNYHTSIADGDEENHLSYD
ncbi:hypothetical protein TanjilG_33064 [Lupinus angustifolius]|uniref:RING-CH-type domain-containing protein n=1 Tax=Lupinus angustifolius TaxID=3871 RepID=A0A1J7HKL4_LUPAN|nr:PREDICTED: uncharacterized protein LOC109345878 [Lupinus angustifolius]OIW13415.1 hypothetical protein TanjilG_33064 [Lupinus angustifolius]